MRERHNHGKGDTDFDRGGPDHIRLQVNPCGAVYELPLDQDYGAGEMRALLRGKTVDDDPDNACDAEGIANPDNLTFLTGLGTLIIAEDTSFHLHDMLWAYQTDKGRLTRLLTAPLWAEVTGNYYYPNVGGWGYLMCTLQHPAEGPALTGYLGPLPVP
jgi:hypothetical protein